MTNGRSVAATAMQKTEVLPETELALYRCRLYRVGEEVVPGQELYVEVWDSEEEPCAEGSLASGELVETCTGASRSEVRNKMDAIQKDLGVLIVSNWAAQGSI